MTDTARESEEPREARSQTEHSLSVAMPPDPTFRLSKLAAANRPPISVTPNAPLEEAVTVMLLHDYSQLPIMSSERDVKRVISWKSIASRLATGHEGKVVRDFMDSVETLDATASLFDAIRVIVDRQYVLVRGQDRKISGIVTSSDLSAQFQFLTEPFLLLAEIENELRRVLQDTFAEDELASAKDPADSGRTIRSAQDMTFGESFVSWSTRRTGRNWASISIGALS